VEEHTSGLTSGLLLDYVERRGGREAVAAVLARAGATDDEKRLRDENAWISYALKIALFEATVEVLADPDAIRKMGASAVEANIGHGMRLALQALGSPRFVYQNLPRSNSRFSRSHVMELVELRGDFARARFVDVTGVPFSPLDCDYTAGLLSCVPKLFGGAPARVSHPECVGDGAEACVFEMAWERRTATARPVVAAGALLGVTALAFPPALPGVAALAAGVAALTLHRTQRARRRHRDGLEVELRSQAEMNALLLRSMHDLVSELRVDDVLAKIIDNARAAAGGKHFILVLDDGEHTGSSLPSEAVAVLDGWVARSRRLYSHAVLIDDTATSDDLAALAPHARSLCAAPLLVRGERLGVLVGHAVHPQSFLPRDVDLVEWYATQAAIALNNARLYRAQEELARRDSLTGLLNHREFHETLEHELERSRRSGDPLSVLLLDLDRFKAVNDTFGHAEGDVVLRGVGRVLAEQGRAGDLPFRIGGDEFAVLLPLTGPGDAQAVGARLAEAIHAAHPRIGASVGTATWPIDGGSKDVLIAEADHNLYAAKGARAPQRERP
jgi:diguanylate cyclase (GGDEF)-like protein